jgi:hypothetical protein
MHDDDLYRIQKFRNPDIIQEKPVYGKIMASLLILFFPFFIFKTL